MMSLLLAPAPRGGWAAQGFDLQLGSERRRSWRLELVSHLQAAERGRSVSRTTHRNGAQSAKGPTTKYEPAVGGAVGSSGNVSAGPITMLRL